MNILLGSFKDSWAPPSTGPVSDPQGVALLSRQRVNFVLRRHLDAQGKPTV